MNRDYNFPRGRDHLRIQDNLMLPIDDSFCRLVRDAPKSFTSDEIEVVEAALGRGSKGMNYVLQKYGVDEPDLECLIWLMQYAVIEVRRGERCFYRVVRGRLLNQGIQGEQLLLEM